MLCNGALLTASRWLSDGDRLRVGEVRIRCRRAVDGYQLVCEQVAPDRATDRPHLVPPPRSSESEAAGPRIRPVPYTPTALVDDRRRGLRAPWRSLTVLLFFASLAAPAWFLLTARSVALEIEPRPERIALAGGLARPKIGDRYLLRPGTYRLNAGHPGYRDLERALEVGPDARQVFELRLEELPGLLAVATLPASAAEVWIDGQMIGEEPLETIEVEKGLRQVRISAEGYVEYTTELEIEGLGQRQALTAELTPLWAPVAFRSRPPGARIVVDGEPIGKTPATERLLAGSHRLELRLAKHKTHRERFTVQPDEALTLPLAVLELADGGLTVVSEPLGATVTADGVFRGTTPLELELSPGAAHELVISKAGYESQSHEVELEAAEGRELAVELEARLGEVVIEARPAAAELWVDGEPRGGANQTLRLVAVPHQLEVRSAGFLPHRESVTPRPGFQQVIRVVLETEAEVEVREKKIESVVHTAQDQELRLIAGGRFQMGASRREPGRRANEALRTVEISRSFYLATQEVSNRQFREFADGHRSGRVGHASLEVDHHPVVRVSWEDAARYCNWLSEKDALPPFYVERSGGLVAAKPFTRGYRLPLESEWAWAARYPDGKTRLKYPWGDSLPVPPGFANFADQAARGLLRDVLAGYEDGFMATSPIESFQPNTLGLFNLGGNVAEWSHDLYSLYAAGVGAVDRDPTGPEDGEFHVIRGSSWMHDSVTELRLSFRDYGKEPRPDLGFRIARFLE